MYGTMAQSVHGDNSRQDETSRENLGQGERPVYRMYPIRWLVLLTIFLFNLSNNLLWISFSAVGTTGNITM